jgi:hypothetical protein
MIRRRRRDEGRLLTITTITQCTVSGHLQLQSPGQLLAYHQLIINTLKA